MNLKAATAGIAKRMREKRIIITLNNPNMARSAGRERMSRSMRTETKNKMPFAITVNYLVNAQNLGTQKFLH